MKTDLTGGLDEAREFLFPDQPDNPEMRESVNCWLWDDGSAFGMPRIGVEAVGDQWDTHDVQLNLAFADGRVLNMFGPGPRHDRLGTDSQPRVLGAGPISFELVEPFRHWRLRVAGSAEATTVQAQMDGWVPGDPGVDPVTVELDADIVHAVPPWETGTLLEEAGHVLANQDEGDMMGGPRFEQLFGATGTLTVGDQSYAISGGGLRIRRTGVRRLATFRGHTWQSTVFPSGRAFGHLVYPPRDDGKPTFNEGFIFEGEGPLIPARVVSAPWLRSIQPSGQEVGVVLETARETITIEGETILSTYHALGAGSGSGLILQQAIAGYRWEGESANGMLERSSPNEQISPN